MRRFLQICAAAAVVATGSTVAHSADMRLPAPHVTRHAAPLHHPGVGRWHRPYAWRAPVVRSYRAYPYRPYYAAYGYRPTYAYGYRPYYRPFYRPYAYRPVYYRPYAYRPFYYRPYAYRPYLGAYAFRPHYPLYRPYWGGYHRPWGYRLGYNWGHRRVW